METFIRKLLSKGQKVVDSNLPVSLLLGAENICCYNVIFRNSHFFQNLMCTAALFPFYNFRQILTLDMRQVVYSSWLRAFLRCKPACRLLENVVHNKDDFSLGVQTWREIKAA